MSRGKNLSLEEARKTGKLKQFSKEHPSQADGRFWSLLDAMAKGTLEARQTSSADASDDCNDTQTPRYTTEDAGG